MNCNCAMPLPPIFATFRIKMHSIHKKKNFLNLKKKNKQAAIEWCFSRSLSIDVKCMVFCCLAAEKICLFVWFRFVICCLHSIQRSANLFIASIFQNLFKQTALKYKLPASTSFLECFSVYSMSVCGSVCAPPTLKENKFHSHAAYECVAYGICTTQHRRTHIIQLMCSYKSPGIAACR